MEDKVRDYPTAPISDWQEIENQEGRDAEESRRVEERIREQQERERRIIEEREKKA